MDMHPGEFWNCGVQLYSAEAECRSYTLEEIKINLIIKQKFQFRKQLKL